MIVLVLPSRSLNIVTKTAPCKKHVKGLWNCWWWSVKTMVDIISLDEHCLYIADLEKVELKPLDWR